MEVLGTHDSEKCAVKDKGVDCEADSPDTAKALECMERSLALGYANRYDWTANTDGRITVAPLRTLPAFSALLARFNHIFN